MLCELTALMGRRESIRAKNIQNVALQLKKDSVFQVCYLDCIVNSDVIILGGGIHNSRNEKVMSKLGKRKPVLSRGSPDRTWARGKWVLPVETDGAYEILQFEDGGIQTETSHLFLHKLK